MSELTERLDKLREKIQTDDFLEGKGLANEVNIWFFCYEPKEEMTVRDFIGSLTTSQSLKCHPVEYNLYKVFLAICDDKRITDRVPALEEKRGSEFVLTQMENIATNTKFVEKMRETPHKPGDVVFITGVGEAFPFIRVHALLEAMQPHFSDVPVLVFYPGTFDGHAVTLFNRLKPNSYYRAFNALK